MGSVDGLVEMYKLREQISKTKEEIISDGITSTYKHKLGPIYSRPISLSDHQQLKI